MDEGEYFILTKERQTDVFTRVRLEDVAQRRRQEAPARGGGVPIGAEEARSSGSSQISCFFSEAKLGRPGIW